MEFSELELSFVLELGLEYEPPLELFALEVELFAGSTNDSVDGGNEYDQASSSSSISIMEALL